MRQLEGALWGLMLAAVAVAACGPARKVAPKPPLVTDKGAPAGQAATATLGSSGGSVASPDAKLTLTVPSGALAAQAELSIQPLTNLAPGGKGAAFRLAPEGQTFANPVTLTFHYTDADLAGTAAEALGIAYQDEQGVWRSLKAVTLDAAAKTVSVSTTHFSDWSLVSGFQLRPAAGAVDLNQQLLLEVDFCQSQDVGDGLATLLAACEPTNFFPVTGWSVNGIAGGNQSVGSIDEVNQGMANYTAPASKPAGNPVAVSAETTVGKQKILLTANLTIGGAARWAGTVTSVTTQDTPGVKTRTEKSVATVTFAFDEGNAIYFSSGTVSFNAVEKDLTNSCQTTTTGSAPIGSQDGILEFVPDTAPRAYWSYGSTPASLTLAKTCPDGTHTSATFDSAIVWWTAAPVTAGFTVKPDGTLDDAATAPVGTGSNTQTWHFDPMP